MLSKYIGHAALDFDLKQVRQQQIQQQPTCAPVTLRDVVHQRHRNANASEQQGQIGTATADEEQTQRSLLALGVNRSVHAHQIVHDGYATCHQMMCDTPRVNM